MMTVYHQQQYQKKVLLAVSIIDHHRAVLIQITLLLNINTTLSLLRSKMSCKQQRTFLTVDDINQSLKGIFVYMYISNKDSMLFFIRFLIASRPILGSTAMLEQDEARVV
jgi:hypothetical protein